MLLTADQLDDEILEVGANGFLALDTTAKATLLADTTLAAARNSLCRSDGLVGARPGLRHVGQLVAAALGGTADTQGAVFYGAGAVQALLVLRRGVLTAVPSLDEATPVQLATGFADGRVIGTQLVNRAFFTLPSGGLLWSMNAAGWTTGTVTAYADASAMPVFGALCAHGYRLLASPVGTDEIYASTLLGGGVPADWSRSVQIRVGTGRADPVVVLLSGQDTFLHVLKASSVWRVDTSDASAGNWQIGKLTDKCGCVSAGSAVQLGQDTLFLARQGVISLAALATTDALSEASIISTPIDAAIRRINWNAAAKIVAEAWGPYYLLALPLDGDAAPRDVFAYDVTRKAWVGQWRIEMPDTGAAAPGIGALVAATFGGIPELVVADNGGQLRRLDADCTVDEITRVAGVATAQDVVQRLRTKSWDFGAPDNFKSFMNLTVEFWDSTSATAQLYLVRDGKDPELVSGSIRATANPGFPLGFPLGFQRDKSLSRSFSLRRYGRAREVSLEIAETTGQLSVRAVRLSAFVDPAEVRR